MTLGPALPLSVGSFLRDMFTTNAGWVMIVAGGLFLGSIPLFLGLIVVMPVLGQVTWHLYREVV